MATLKSIFPTWQNMWAGYSQNYYLSDEAYKKTLGGKTIHILVLHSVWNYWKNDEFEDDEESAIDKIMTLIRAKAIRLCQNQILYLNIYEKLKVPTQNYLKVQETAREDLAPPFISSTLNITKSRDTQHQGLQYPSRTDERINRQQGKAPRQINQKTFNKYLPIDKAWVARLLHSFSESGIDLEATVQEFHPIFCTVYPFEEGEYNYDETVQEYKWKSKRVQEEIETDPNTGQPLDDESLRDIEENEYRQWKNENREGLRPTWYLEGTHRFLGRLKKEVKKLSATSKQKQEQRIEATEKLIKIYEKNYQRPTLDFFFEKLNEMEGYEEYKNIVGNYFVNLLNPTSVPFRPLSFILVGPPGTGKSAIAAITAEAAGRTFIRIPMNGQDEPTYLKGREIAYGGASQGKILKEILSKGSCQPVVLVDELTRAKGKALMDIIGTMTDPDQNGYAFEDDWLKWKIDLSQCVFIIADNHIEKIDPFLLSRSSIINIPILSYEKRRELVKKRLRKTLDAEDETRGYINQITDDFCKYIITEEWGVRQTLANINNLFLGLRASVLMNNPINDFNNITEVKEDAKTYALIYEGRQKITLVRVHEQEKKLDGTVHSVLTDVSDWPGGTPHDEEEERRKITILDLEEQELYNFDFTRYPELEYLNVRKNILNKLDLSANSKLKYLDFSYNFDLYFDDTDIILGEAKKSLEEMHFIGIGTIDSENIFGERTEAEAINLKEFKKLEKISYDWKSAMIYLDRRLRNKVELIYPAWQDLHEDDKLEYAQNNPNTNYEDLMKSKVVFED